MARKIFYSSLLALPAVLGLNNGVGKLPKMGYDSKSQLLDTENHSLAYPSVAFNAFECNYNETATLNQAEAMVANGLVALGYNVCLIVSLTSRDSIAHGITVNPTG